MGGISLNENAIKPWRGADHAPFKNTEYKQQAASSNRVKHIPGDDSQVVGKRLKIRSKADKGAGLQTGEQ